MNNDKMLNETGKKVLEELKKHKEELDKNKKTQTYISARKLFESALTDVQQDETLNKNFQKTLGKLRSENIKFDMEIIEHRKDH